MTDKTILTIRQAAKIYGLPEFCLRGLVKRGVIRCIKSGNRAYITRQAIEEYLATGGGEYAHQ